MIRFLVKSVLFYALYAIALMGVAASIIIVRSHALNLFLISSPLLILELAVPIVFDQRHKARASRVAPGLSVGVEAASVDHRGEIQSLKALLIALPLLYGVHYLAADVDAAREREILSAHRYSSVPTSWYPVRYGAPIFRWRSTNFSVTNTDRRINGFFVDLQGTLVAVGIVGKLLVFTVQTRRQAAPGSQIPQVRSKGRAVLRFAAGRRSLRPSPPQA